MKDTIYRQDAIDIASGYCHPANIAKELMKLPSAEPEQKTGKWVQHPWSRRWDVCSACGIGCKRREYGVQDGHEWMSEESYRFCPHCGAKMEV